MSEGNSEPRTNMAVLRSAMVRIHHIFLTAIGSQTLAVRS